MTHILLRLSLPIEILKVKNLSWPPWPLVLVPYYLRVRDSIWATNIIEKNSRCPFGASVLRKMRASTTSTAKKADDICTSEVVG